MVGYPYISVPHGDYFVRRVRSLDLPKIKGILKESSCFNKTEQREIIRQVTEFFKNPQGEMFRTFVCKKNDDIAGFICFGTDCGEDTYEISFLYVSPKYQRTGVGTVLLQHAEKHIRQKNGRIIFLYTSSSRDYVPAQKLYGKNGFKKTAVVTDFFDDGDSKVFFSKRLRKIKNRGLNHVK